eukprot:5425111-Amphidinium_carterae.1
MVRTPKVASTIHLEGVVVGLWLVFLLWRELSHHESRNPDITGTLVLSFGMLVVALRQERRALHLAAVHRIEQGRQISLCVDCKA